MLMNIEKHLNLLDYEIAWSVSLFFIAYVSEEYHLLQSILCFS